VSVCKRGRIYWYEFFFAHSRIRESSKSPSRTVAREAERARRRELEEAFNRIKKPRTAHLFSVAAQDWLQTKMAYLSPRSVEIERANLKHLNPFFGKLLLCDIGADDIARYQIERLAQKAAPKTINLEVGTLRAVLRRNRLWAQIQPDVRTLKARDDVGRAISQEEEKRLLEACLASRVSLALSCRGVGSLNLYALLGDSAVAMEADGFWETGSAGGRFQDRSGNGERDPA